MNPPTRGHEGLVRHMLNEAQKLGADPYIVVTLTQDPKKNPLTPNQKVRYLNQMFPGVPKLVSSNPLPIIEKLGKNGYNEVTMVIGENRGRQFNWVKTPKSVANRPKGAVSATMTRNAAARNNFNAFKKLVSNKVNARGLMNNVRRGLGVGAKRSPMKSPPSKRRRTTSVV